MMHLAMLASLSLTALSLTALSAAPESFRLERAESPFTVVVVAARTGGIAPVERALLAAFLETPHAWPAQGALRKLLRRGGQVRATATPEGLLLRLDGHAQDRDLILAAATALRRLEKPSAKTLARAQGRVLRRRHVHDHHQGHTQGNKSSGDHGQENPRHDDADTIRTLWKIWYAKAAPVQKPHGFDIALHRLQADALWEIYQAWVTEIEIRSAFTTLLEGPGAPIAPGIQPVLALKESALKESALKESALKESALKESALKRPGLLMPSTGPEFSERRGQVPVATLYAAHPLPPMALSDDVVSMLITALRQTAEPQIDARIERTRHAALLILRTPLQARSAADALAALRLQLEKTRSLLLQPRLRRPLSTQAAWRQAKNQRVIGSRAEAEARSWLVGVTSEDPMTDNQVALEAASLLFAESLRALSVQPTRVR